MRRLAAALLLLCSAALADAQAYQSIVVFGDSLSDTGNVAHLTSAAYGSAAVFPGPMWNYTLGRFTDGRDTGPAAQALTGGWVEQLATSLASRPAVINSLDGGTNYAYANATTADRTTALSYGTNNAFTVNVNNLGQQVTDYLATNPTVTPHTLFIVWTGTNDVLNASTPDQLTAAAARETAQIERLINAGATDILVPNVLPVGSAPIYNNAAATKIAGNQAASTFNQALAADLSALPAANPAVNLHLFPLDVFGLYNSLLGTAASYGFTDVEDSAQGVSSINPDTWLFWDYLHPTTAGHQQIALAALALITPSATSTTLTSSNPDDDLGVPVTFTATVSAASGKPTGTVTFFDNGDPVDICQVRQTSANVATFTTSNLAAATHTITAAYSGATGFDASMSAPITEVVIAPTVAPALATGSITVQAGAAMSDVLTVPSAGGYSGTLTLSCGMLPAHMSCVFSPAALSFAGANNTLTSTLTINTSDAPSTTALLQPDGARWGPAALIVVCSMLPLLLPAARRRRLVSVLCLVLVGAVAAGLSGCSGSTSAASAPVVHKVAVGSYAVPVNLTSGSVTSTLSLTVNVTP